MNWETMYPYIDPKWTEIKVDEPDVNPGWPEGLEPQEDADEFATGVASSSEEECPKGNEA